MLIDETCRAQSHAQVFAGNTTPTVRTIVPGTPGLAGAQV
jgi:hypothetical protein